MDFKQAYWEILADRMNYFKNKKIIDLSDEEIKEFVNLRKEIQKEVGDVVKPIAEIWKTIYSGPFKKYQERVLKK